MTEHAANYVSKTGTKSQKRLIWTENNLFIIYQNYVYWASASTETFWNFCEKFFGLRVEIVDLKA